MGVMNSILLNDVIVVNVTNIPPPQQPQQPQNDQLNF